jgi:hypothetical protein
MKIRGWEDCPVDFQADFNFHKGPKWLLALSHTPYFERYAYPKAISFGLAEAWPNEKGVVLDPTFDSDGWLIHESPKNDFEKWIEGSLALLGQGKKNRSVQFLLRNRKLEFSDEVVIFWHVVPRITFTRYGKKVRLRNDIHRLNGTYKDYKKALRGERFNFIG